MSKFKNKIDEELNKIERDLERLADSKGYDIEHDEQYVQAVKRVVNMECGDESSTYKAWIEVAMAYGQLKERIENYRNNQ